MHQYLKNLRDIYVGWKNYFLIADPEVKKMAEYKANICAGCPLNDNGTCSTSKYGEAVKDFYYKGKLRQEGQTYSGCGCPLEKKLLSDSQCPLGKF